MCFTPDLSSGPPPGAVIISIYWENVLKGGREEPGHLTPPEWLQVGNTSSRKVVADVDQAPLDETED